MSQKKHEILLKALSAGGFLLSAALCVYGWRTGILTSQEKMQGFIAGYGLAGAVVFTLFQAAQVIVPLIPGGLSCLGGVLLFGAWRGFLCNYIGICIGSILAFLISKCCGKPILKFFFPEKVIQKYEAWTSEGSRFSKLFAVAIFLPAAPDDFLCYLAGTTEMTLPHFAAIILLGKPLAIALYSMGLMAVFTRLPSLLGG